VARTPDAYTEEAEQRLMSILWSLNDALRTVMVHVSIIGLSAGVCLLFQDNEMPMKTLLSLQQEWLMASSGFEPLSRADRKKLRTDLELMRAMYNSGGAITPKRRK